MNKKSILSLMGVFLLALMLVGCGTSKTAFMSTSTDRLNTSYASALPVETQLVLGTLKLEGIAQAVDSATAAQLLPLYTLLEQLDTSGTAAQAELDAVLEQLQSSMTADQIQAIAAMKLTQADLLSYLGQNGQSAQVSSVTPAASSSAGGNFPAGSGGDDGAPPAGGDGSSGGAPGGAPSGGTGSNLSQNQIATLQAQKTGTPGFSGSVTPAFLVNQLIQLLQKKTLTSTPSQ
jgi:hypothetical protein